MNAHRGEVAGRFAGVERGLRLTFEGLANIETALGTGIVSVAERFRRHEMGTTDVAAILREGLKGADHLVEEVELRAAMMEMGFVHAARLAAQVLAAGLGIEDTAQEDAGAQTPGKPAAPPSPGNG